MRHDQGAETTTQRVATQGFAGGGVVDVTLLVFEVEHRFASLDKGIKQVAFIVSVALLVNAEIEHAYQALNLLKVIFQANTEIALMRFRGEKTVITQLMACGEWKARVIGVAIDVIRVNAIATFLYR